MAKKTRKKAASRAAKKSKPVAKKKAAKKKSAVAKKTRKVAARKHSKPVAKKKSVAKTTLQPKTAVKKPPETKTVALKPVANPSPESFPHKIARAFNAVVDTLSDAEHLDHELDPGVSREPE